MSPGRPDHEVVRAHLMALDEAVQVLRRHQGVTAVELRADRERLWIVERGLQLCAQNVLDIATHLAASAGLQTPDYETALDRLGEVGVIPLDLAARLRPLAGFRNVLVHGYLELDLELVAQLLRERLEDFAAFAGHVDSFLRAS